MSGNIVHWTLEDEKFGREYEVRIEFAVDDWDPGDVTTPPTGGLPILQDLRVLQARHYHPDGTIRGVDLGAAARTYDDRAWMLVDGDLELHQRIEQSCR